MNSVFIYCAFLFLFCTVCITQVFDNKQVVPVSVAPLRSNKSALGLFFVGIFLLVVFLPALVCAILEKLLAAFQIDEANLMILSMFVSQLLMMFLVFRMKDCFKLPRLKIPFKQLFLFAAQKFGCIFPIVLIASVVWVLFLVLLQKFGIDISLNEQSAVLLFSKSHGILFKCLFCASVTVLAPVIEEYIFRAGIYRVFKAKIDTNSAATLTSAMFAIMHFNLVSLVPLFVLSQYLIRYYERSGSIYTPIIIHGIFNLNSVILIALSANM